MVSNSLLVLVSVLGTLALLSALGGTALLAGAYMSQRERLSAAQRQLDDANRQAQAREITVAEMKAEIKHLAFVRGNKLYSRAEQDLGFAASQSVMRLRVLKADVEEQLTVIEKMLDTTQQVDPSRKVTKPFGKPKE